MSPCFGKDPVNTPGDHADTALHQEMTKKAREVWPIQPGEVLPVSLLRMGLEARSS